MLNAISVDLEDWYQVPLVNIAQDKWYECKPSVCEATERILEFFALKGIKATFFASGYIADRHPDLIASIAQSGHEVESHGYWHSLAYQQSTDEFKDDLVRSVEVIQKITGQRPIGYRSPAWSTSRIPDIASSILSQLGFVYDTSLFPTRNFLYGKMDFCTDTTYLYKDTGLLEIPPTVFDVFGFKVPVTGGFYLRAYPVKIVSALIAMRNRTKPVQIYFHPWEVIDDYPRYAIPWSHAFIQYYHCGTMLDRLDILMKEFPFGSLRQVYPEIEHAISL